MGRGRLPKRRTRVRAGQAGQAVRPGKQSEPFEGMSPTSMGAHAPFDVRTSRC